MRKSRSSPQLSSGFFKAPPVSKASNVTTSSFLFPTDLASSTILDDLKLESITHTTAFQATQCLLQAPPLHDIADNEVAQKNLALCLATPPDVPIRNSVLQNLERPPTRRRRAEYSQMGNETALQR